MSGVKNKFDLDENNQASMAHCQMKGFVPGTHLMSSVTKLWLHVRV